jgi:hypothetical protein
MTVSPMQSAAQASSYFEDTDLERRYPPVFLWLAGTVLVMNICATVVSLMV